MSPSSRTELKRKRKRTKRGHARKAYIRRVGTTRSPKELFGDTE